MTGAPDPETPAPEDGLPAAGSEVLESKGHARKRTMPEVLVQIRNLVKVFRRDNEQVHALEKCSLDIQRGEFLALMGPSGSGKTTLLNIIAGIDRPTGGVVSVEGTDIAGMTDRELTNWRNHHIGFIFQQFNLIPVLTAFENVELPLLLTGLTKAERREHVETALRLVGLQDRMKHYPRQLSGGQEQRVAIARAIATDPSLLLADEPTGDLDARSADEVMHLLMRLNQEFGKTIVMVTHDPRAAHHASRIRNLDKGVLLEEGQLPAE
jgi:putative ABC transport system ATP-binding protein